jgi:hypothetical protein
VATLEAFRARPGIPAYLTARIDAWIESLRAWKPSTKDPLVRARELIEEGQARNRYPADRLGYIQFIGASSAVHRWLDSSPTDRGRISEAFYLLGMAEAHLAQRAWAPETESYLETAIRMDPASPTARRAFDFLEEYTLSLYSGSSGVHLPDSVEADLEELRRLVGGGRT